MQTYVLGFTIIGAKSLQTEDGTPCDPFVVVECCNKIHKTQVKLQLMTIVSWDEDVIWPSIELFPEEFESAYVEFSVYSRNWFTRNYLIGKTSLQLKSINRRQDHLWAKRWLPLRNESGPEDQGMLNITVFCLLPGQSAPSATAQATPADAADEADPAAGGDDFEDLTKAVLSNTVEAPPGKKHHVLINIHRVEDLPPQRGCAGTSPFVTVEFAGSLVKTANAGEVVQHTFNERCRIPVKTPVFEDTILIKLWHNNGWLAADDLLAQGLISFSQLRNNALAPQWFCLYGWNPDEIPDVKEITMSGENVEPNFFKGRLLISGRVEKVEDEDEMQAAGSTSAQAAEEPAMNQVSLFADVYQVCGAVGRECQVEIMFGSASKRTPEWITPNRSGDKESASSQVSKGEADLFSDEKTEETTIFDFTQSPGRIEGLLAMAPEDPASQPHLMINVYTRGVLSGRTRIGFFKARLADFGKYEVGNPTKPKFFPLTPMPYNSMQRSPASVLIVVEQSASDDVTRHNRKNVKPLTYIVRGYVFMARSIETDSSEPLGYAIRMACAGMSKSTEERTEVRPMWMTVLNLKVTLYSDHPKEPPTMEPITLTLCDQKTIPMVSYKQQSDLGKAVCTYEYMRTKDNMGNWETYRLKPQWVRLNGGQYGTKKVGEVLVGFELLHKKFLNELSPQEMWPSKETSDSEGSAHFCRLRKATLHFCLYGLRDIMPLGFPASLNAASEKPVVTVNVKKFDPACNDISLPEKDQYYTDSFTYQKLVNDGDESVKEDNLLVWTSNSLGCKDCKNYEMLQVKQIPIMIPDNMILQPYLRIKVTESPSTVAAALTKATQGPYIGETYLSLGHLLPCSWYEGVDLKVPFEKQRDKIQNMCAATVKAFTARETFVEETEKERYETIKAERKQKLLQAKGDAQHHIERDEEKPEQVNSTGLPLQLREHHPKTNPTGVMASQRQKLILKPIHLLNMFERNNFSPREGEDMRVAGQGSGRPMVETKLENATKKDVFINDFWFKGRPLLRNHDIIDLDDETREWYFLPGEAYGFVKCAFKLSDGWEGEEASKDGEGADISSSKEPLAAISEADAAAEQDDDDEPATESDFTPLYSSFSEDPLLDTYAWDQKKLTDKFKGKASIPTRVRCRIYLVRAIVVVGKGAGWADPFLDFVLGQDIYVTMRNMAVIQSNNPEFFRMEERDIDMPTQARLEVVMSDLEEMGLAGDTWIGSTIIDLEDRWHSSVWKKAKDRQRVPTENRPLYSSTQPGVNRGSLEMWVEMLDSVEASSTKATELRSPEPVELEIRLVIWNCENVKPVDGDKTDVKIYAQIDCAKYGGHLPAEQVTDVHQNSDGHAEFNWRIVYPSVKMPVKGCTIQLGLYDYNLLGDVYIASLNLDVKKYLEKVAKDLDLLSIEKTSLRFQSAKEEDEGLNVGEIEISMDILTSSEAQGKEAGAGRDEPNDYPQLITPTLGRGWGAFFSGFGFSMPDLGLMKKLAPIIVVVLVAVVGLKYVKLL